MGKKTTGTKHIKTEKISENRKKHDKKINSVWGSYSVYRDQWPFPGLCTAASFLIICKCQKLTFFLNICTFGFDLLFSFLFYYATWSLELHVGKMSVIRVTFFKLNNLQSSIIYFLSQNLSKRFYDCYFMAMT